MMPQEWIARRHYDPNYDAPLDYEYEQARDMQMDWMARRLAAALFTIAIFLFGFIVGIAT